MKNTCLPKEINLGILFSNKRVAKYLLVILIAAGSIQHAAAQKYPHQFWYPGKLVLEDKSTLKGNIKYDLQNNTVALRAGGKIRIYTARKVIHFELYDTVNRRHRKMYALPYELNNAYRTPIFFELLQEGKITLLCREVVRYKTALYPSPFGGYSSDLALDYDYFLLGKNGGITFFAGEKADWLELMASRREAIKKFVKEHKLFFNNPFDISRIVAFYNSLYKK